MRKDIKILICGLASILFYNEAALSDNNARLVTIQSKNVNVAKFMQMILSNIERQIPELKSSSITVKTPASSPIWHGEEFASASFFLKGDPRYHPAKEFPRQAALVPYTDLTVTVSRYASPSQAQKDFELDARMRPMKLNGRELYKGAALYQYISKDDGSVTCQSKQYVIDIDATHGGSSLVMKVLDVVLAELGSPISKSK